LKKSKKYKIINGEDWDIIADDVKEKISAQGQCPRMYEGESVNRSQMDIKDVIFES
jgi:hypothetical protein